MAVKWVLVWLSSCTRSLGQELYADTGLLAEYFAPLPPSETCVGSGSTRIFENRLPSLVRREQNVDFKDRSDFSLKRCAWEQDTAGNLRYECRGEEEMIKNFAARFTGYIFIYYAGYYNFQLEADDGARLIIGHNDCPGLSCATRYNVTNFKFEELRRNNVDDNSYAKHCTQCSLGVYIDCWVTHYGCEPFSIWQLEADGGNTGNCSYGPRVVNSTRWLEGGLHAVRLEYFQRGGPGTLIWKYSGPDTDNTVAVVPPNKLGFPRSAALQKDVFDMEDGDITRLPRRIELGRPPPEAKLLYREDDKFQLTGPGEGQFSKDLEAANKAVYVRWLGFLQVDVAGFYEFMIESDDGGRLTLGGRGYGGEQVIVNNDGIKEGARITETNYEILPGLHPIRIEYFFKPDPSAAGLALSRPPGIKVMYSGPDTGGVYRSIAYGVAMITMYDYGCEMRRFDWGNGMSVSRDCSGTCFTESEAMVGDRICDDGLFGTNSLNCFKYNYDNYDCDPDYALVTGTTPRPKIECQTSCPAGDWMRRSCDRCAKQTADGERCLESYSNRCPSGNPEDCSFLRCCVAKVTRTNYWGEDCIAYGTPTNCSHELENILDELQTMELPLDARSVYDPLKPRPRARGDLMVDCNQDGCNEITKEFKINPFTGLETDQYVCPVQESADLGVACYIGPFDVLGITDVETQCQGGAFRWNFCKGRKATDGRPFNKCCNFLYVNPLGYMECRFMGIAQGDCQQTLNGLTYNLSTSPYTAISRSNVLQECGSDFCNNPEDEYYGCPSVIDKAPAITDGLRPTDEPDLATILKGSKERPPDPPPWGLIGGLSSVPFVLVICALILRRSFAEGEESPWHSTSAKVVSEDTFIEPHKDHYTSGSIQSHLNYDLTYGRVEARPFGLKALQDEAKVIPQALRQHPDFAVPEATNAAWADAIAFEASIANAPPGDDTTSSGEGDFQPLENIDMAAHRKGATSAMRTSSTAGSGDDFSDGNYHQALSVGTSRKQSRLNTGKSSAGSTAGHSRMQSRAPSTYAISDRPTTPGGRSVRSASAVSQAPSRAVSSSMPGAIVEVGYFDDGEDELVTHQGNLPAPPTPPPQPEIGHVEASVSGLALNQVSVGNLHRPAAAARMLRQQKGHPGVPRVAT